MLKLMDPTSAGFMVADSRNTPMHVGGLHLYEPPDGAGPDWVRGLYDRYLESDVEATLYRKRPIRSVRTGGQWAWTEDDQFDLEYHLRLSALPSPGRVRELLELVGRLHGARMSFERPLWEIHAIEGLADGRVAMYSKLHHALVDGVSAIRLLQATLSTDPAADTPPPWTARRQAAKVEKEQAALRERLLETPLGAVRSAVAVAGEAAGLPATLLRTLNRGLRNETAPLTFHAPKTILNRNITGARRFAAQQWPIERMRAVGKASGATINDVVLAMCSGALRTYLQELDALPDSSLIAMVPVSLKLSEADTASTEGGNAVGAVMVRLATDLPDPAERLRTVTESVRSGKEALAGMSPLQFLAMSALGVTPSVLLPMLRLQGLTRPPFNLVISNVPGPRKQLFMQGARLQGMYPLSIPLHGQAMNITCMSYDGQMGFGLTGCRRTAPSLQRLLIHLDDELAGLEKAAGVG